MTGYGDAIDFATNLIGEAGWVDALGTLTILDSRVGVRNLSARAGAVALENLGDWLPTTRLNGHVSGWIEVDTIAGATGELLVQIDSSTVTGVAIDSVRAKLAAGADLARVDSLGLWAPRASAEVRGGIGLTQSSGDTMLVSAVVDSVGIFEPALVRTLGLAPSDTTPPPAGSLVLTAEVSGALQNYAVSARARADSVRWRDIELFDGRIRGFWESADSGLVRLDGAVDSLAVSRFAFSGIEARVDGRRDPVRLGGAGSVGRGWLVDFRWPLGGGLNLRHDAATGRVWYRRLSSRFRLRVRGRSRKWTPSGPGAPSVGRWISAGPPGTR